MKRFEYEITKHAAEEFKQFVYFCTDKGACELDGLISDQLELLNDFLNKKGALGWELIQVFVNESGLVALWKREMTGNSF